MHDAPHEVFTVFEIEQISSDDVDGKTLVVIALRNLEGVVHHFTGSA